MHTLARSLWPLLAATAAAQTTWTVPIDRPTLQAAIDAAQPGDTITMTAGYHDAGSVTLTKAITLRNCRVAYPDGAFGLRIQNLLGGSRTEFVNVSIGHFGNAFSTNASTALRVDVPVGTVGDIVFDNVAIYGPVTRDFNRAALQVVRLGDATLTARRCRFTGSSGNTQYVTDGEAGFDGGQGAVLAPGRYLFEQCTFTGGLGGDAFANPMQLVRGRPGGAGLVVADPQNAALVGCTVTDGDGGGAYGSPAYPPSDPCAIAAQPGVSVLPAELFDVVWQRGRIGSVVQCASQPPRPQPLALGRSIDLVSAAETFTTGQTIAVQLTFRPTDNAALLGAGTTLRRTDFPGILGPVWMQDLVFGVFLTPPTAGATVTVPLPTVPPGLLGPIDFVAQVLHGSDQVPHEVGAPRVVTLRP